jgi:D-alanine-D-alanine ligase-like ATP-grasp enzyme
MTEEVDPSLKQLATDAAHATSGLMYARLDTIAEDHRRPLHVQTVCTLEINHHPMLSIHHLPAQGKARHVSDAIIRHIFFGDDRVDRTRIPFDENLFTQRCRGLVSANDLHERSVT